MRLEEAAWSSIDRAMKATGFRFISTRAGETTYRGQVRSGQVEVPIRIAITDPLLIPPPRVFVDDDAIRDRIGAHLNEDKSLCYADGAEEEYDPYNAGGAVLRVLVSVKTTLDQVLHGSSRADLQREFVSYWKADGFLFTDLPPGYSGKARTAPMSRVGRTSLMVTLPDRIARWSDATLDTARHAYVLRPDRPLNTAIGAGPGPSLASLRAWLDHFVDDKAVLAEAFAPRLIDRGRIVILSENGSVAASFIWPALVGKAYAKAPASRRAGAITRGEDQMTLDRAVADSLSLADLVNARLETPSPLVGMAIAVIGAGAIGARLCPELVRCGAGLADKPMLVIDPDVYQAVNFARHTLPISAVRTGKAAALCAEIQRLHPGFAVEAVERSAFTVLPRLASYDLVVDATGSTPVGLRLNAFAQERRRLGDPFPAVLHAAVHGNGAAVQTILVTPSEHACFKCLRPEHGVLKADPLKPGVSTRVVSGACGDGAHVTYAAAAPAMAAALAVQAILEWAEHPSDPGPRVRSRVLNQESTAPPKDRSWARDDNCPACGAGAP